MTLTAPDGGLRVSVVVPAKDEEERIPSSLDALAGQSGVSRSSYEVILVLDGCTDSTADVVEDWRKGNRDLSLHTIQGPAKGVGFARKLGMDIAYSRLIQVGRPGALISSTDADSVVDADWISAQISLADAGAEAIGGRIELEAGGENLPPDVLVWYASQGRRRYEKILDRYGGDLRRTQEHWQFSGASMSVTAEVYRSIGGLGSVVCLEDERLERQLEEAGVDIVRSSAVRVTTSDRTSGRAEEGLAANLARADLKDTYPKRPAEIS